MRGQIEREIERRDKAARPDGHALPHAHIAFGARRNVERLHLAIIARGFFGGDAECVDQAAYFAFGIGDGLARLNAQRIGQFLAALGKAAHAMIEHIAFFIARQPRHRLRRAHRARDGLLDHIGRGQCGAKRDFAGELIRHRQIGVWLHRLVVEIERVDVF